MTTVLVCDDAPLAREAIRRAVGAVPGVERVTAAGSGEEVLARFPIERPDLVLMDVRMPGIGGVGLQHELNARGVGWPVIVITGYADATTENRVREAGAHAFLKKPFDDALLIDVVAHAIEADRRAR